MTDTLLLGIDPGAGAIKLYGPAGGVQLPSVLAIDEGRATGRMVGLAQRKPPLRVRTDNGAFYIGAGAHEWGRPLEEDLDHDRFTGSPALRALLYGGLTAYSQKDLSLERRMVDEPICAFVGLPLEALSGDSEVTEGVRRWLTAEHHWQADGQSCAAVVGSVKITSQAAGALFDFLLDETGAFIPARKAMFDKEIGIISVGMNTVELMVARGGATEERFTAGRTAGVRRLLDLLNPAGLYSMGELDTQLRAGRLDLSSALPVWGREVVSFLEKRWGQAHRRFAAVVMVGGGALLLQHALLSRFGGKAYVPDDPVLATARGLYKMALMQAKRPRRSLEGQP
jgi:hypothetical protein